MVFKSKNRGLSEVTFPMIQFFESKFDQSGTSHTSFNGLVDIGLNPPLSWENLGLTGVGKCPFLGNFGHHLQISVGDHTPISWVMFDWDINPNPLRRSRADIEINSPPDRWGTNDKVYGVVKPSKIPWFFPSSKP